MLYFYKIGSLLKHYVLELGGKLYNYSLECKFMKSFLLGQPEFCKEKKNVAIKNRKKQKLNLITNVDNF